MRQYILLDDYDRPTVFDKLKDLKDFVENIQGLRVFKRSDGYYKMQS